VFRTAKANTLGTPRFLLGRLMATPEALNAFAATAGNPINYVVRHMNLDPGSLGAEDQLANLKAVREGARVLSAYELRDGTRIWIITEADRSVTTILLPEEYWRRASYQTSTTNNRDGQRAPDSWLRHPAMAKESDSTSARRYGRPRD